MELEKILQEWEKDAVIDQTEPGKELIRIPLLHSKYLNFLTKHKMATKKVNYDYLRMRKIKVDYFQGRLDQEELDTYGWEPFQFVLKSDINTYLEADNDLIKLLEKKVLGSVEQNKKNKQQNELKNKRRRIIIEGEGI